MCDEDSQEMNIRPESLTVHVSCVCAMWELFVSLVCSVLCGLAPQSTCAGALVEGGSQRTGHSSEVCITNPLLLRVMQSSRQR
jgi:hypothetical protein